MISNTLSTMWAALAPALGNHLWQSTLFAAIAALFALFLRINHARTRYALWLAASMKFLIPFSLLTAIGSYLAQSRGYAAKSAGFYVAMEEASQPFTQRATPLIPQSAVSTAFANLIHALPAALAIIWLCGFAVVLFVWCIRLRRVTRATKAATPLTAGREVQALRRVARVAGIRKPIEILLSRASLEPGIFGIARPVLLWPEGISERLEDAHLEAILAHEVWHVRRRDNLAAALHMAVEAIFWFYPPVWWLGTRLVEERERACDEEVLRLGSEPEVYAQSILKTCEFCVESPLACVSGVTGSNLKKRIVRIMRRQSARQLSFSRKLLLIGVGIAAIAFPVVFGLVNAPRARAQFSQATGAPLPTFDVVTIKPSPSAPLFPTIQMRPGAFIVTGSAVQFLIEFAYDLKSVDQLSGGPSWISTEKYDIQATYAVPQPQDMQKVASEQDGGQLKLRVQSLLADRFGLKITHVAKILPIYALVVADGGPKFQQAKPGEMYPNGIKGMNGLPGGPHTMQMTSGDFTIQALPMATVASVLSERLGRVVVDETGLKGDYDFSIQWPPLEAPPVLPMPGTTPQYPLPGSPIFTTVEEQLGLRLQPLEAPVDSIVISDARQPTGN
jgi:bla regulator protein blaR1